MALVYCSLELEVTRRQSLREYRLRGGHLRSHSEHKEGLRSQHRTQGLRLHSSRPMTLRSTNPFRLNDPRTFLFTYATVIPFSNLRSLDEFSPSILSPTICEDLPHQ